MSRLWLFIDAVITAPFFMAGYLASAVVNTSRYGWHKYVQNYCKARDGEL